MVCLGVFIGYGSYQMAHSALSFWATGLFGLQGGALIFAGFSGLKLNKTEQQNAVPASSNAEARLDELERLKRRDMVTPEEYATKRQEILKDL